MSTSNGTSQSGEIMMKLQSSKASQIPQYSADALPCRVGHSSRLPDPRRFWQPSQDKDGNGVAYFRGRKLRSQAITLPQGYKGVVVQKSGRIAQDNTLKDQALADLEGQRTELSAEEYAEELEELRMASARGELTAQVGELDELATFDQIAVWGHDALPAEDDNPYARTLNEYIAFSNAVSPPS